MERAAVSEIWYLERFQRAKVTFKINESLWH